jgi:dTDP-4-dehydrorhamnose 3,5-epimerase
MNREPRLIEGGLHTDHRGEIRYINDFKLQGIKRFYTIKHYDPSTIRAWQGHKKETKYFYCLDGEFLINLVTIDDWENPSIDLQVTTFLLNPVRNAILEIPPGNANGFKATVPGSHLLVFSDKTLEESIKDDYRFDQNFWHNWET